MVWSAWNFAKKKNAAFDLLHCLEAKITDKDMWSADYLSINYKLRPKTTDKDMCGGYKLKEITLK